MDEVARSLAPQHTKGRIDRARALFDRYECQALLVTKLENIAYLTGFSGSAAMLLITKDSAVFVSDGRYRDQAEQQLCANGIDATIVIGAAAKQMESLVLAVPPGARLGLEDRDVTWSFLTRATKEFTNPIVATAGCIEELRVIKDAGEIDRIERACSIADQALAEVKTRLVERPSEAEFAAELEFAMRRFGSSGVSFETIVASGERGAFPHARPTGRVVNEGDLVVVDFGAMVDGYHSDMTRTFIVGPPSDEQRTHYEAVQIAQQAGVDAVRAGVAASEVDRACRDQLDALGFGDYFTHGTGHGVGREIHEAPSVGGRVTDSLSVGMVVTVEPGVYLPGVGGVRIEDTLVVTNDGTRTLTKSTKDYQL